MNFHDKFKRGATYMPHTLITYIFNGEYRDSNATIKALKNAKCNQKIIDDLQRLFEKGPPNHMNASTTHQNFLDFSDMAIILQLIRIWIN